MSTLHFWPEDIVNDLPASPLTVLKEAAAELGQATKGAVEVDVRLDTENSYGDEADYDFALLSKAMNFRYLLFSASFNPVLLYPCRIYGNLLDQMMHMETEAEFRQELVELLHSPKAVSIVKAMLAQSQ